MTTTITAYQRDIILAALRLFEAQLKGEQDVTSDDVCFHMLRRHPSPDTVARLAEKLYANHPDK
jgi:hypothetical protein